MTKITDIDYFLPLILPSSKNESCTGGATLPILITGTCSKNYEESEYILKFNSGEGMTPCSLIKELLGAFIAMELSLNVVLPVTIDLNKDFIETIDNTEELKIAQKSLGLNYGSKYITSLLPISRDIELNFNQRQEAIKILIFDILINNIDRNYRKPNMLTDGNKIYIFDHEKAFSFIETLHLNIGGPWKLEKELTWIKNHFFWKEFKGKLMDISNFIDSFLLLDNNFWTKSENLIPVEWKERSDCFIDIKNHINSVIENKEIFKSEIERILL